MSEKYFAKKIEEKQMLCSRDIQVGEEFKWEDKTLVSLGHGDDDNRYWIHAAYLGKRTAFDVTKAYKVIGEISPEANIAEGQNLSQLEVDGLRFNNWLT